MFHTKGFKKKSLYARAGRTYRTTLGDFSFLLFVRTQSLIAVRPQLNWGSHLFLVHTHRPSPTPLPSVLTPWPNAHFLSLNSCQTVGTLQNGHLGLVGMAQHGPGLGICGAGHFRVSPVLGPWPCTVFHFIITLQNP